MQNMQAIKSRIQSVSGTRQITQSMRLVSTAKVQRARSRMEASTPFLEGMDTLLALTAGDAGNPRHPYLAGQEGPACIIVISSDRGLCGGYNINVCKAAAALAQRQGEARMVAVGAKVGDYCRRGGLPVAREFLGVSERPFFQDAQEIALLALDWFDRGEVGSIHVAFTRFQTLLSQLPVTRQLLPLPQTAEGEAPPGPRPLTRFEPGAEALLAKIVPFYLSTRLYGAMLEAAACEQSARVTSMDSAVKNADEMIDSLSLLYNQARQGAITQEVTEIIGGAEALADRE